MVHIARPSSLRCLSIENCKYCVCVYMWDNPRTIRWGLNAWTPMYAWLLVRRINCFYVSKQLLQNHAMWIAIFTCTHVAKDLYVKIFVHTCTGWKFIVQIAFENFDYENYPNYSSQNKYAWSEEYTAKLSCQNRLGQLHNSLWKSCFYVCPGHGDVRVMVIPSGITMIWTDIKMAFSQRNTESFKCTLA